MFFSSRKGGIAQQPNNDAHGLNRRLGVVFLPIQTVQALTPSRSVTCFAVSSGSSRRFLKCSPTIFGSRSVSFGFSPLRVMGANCKRAARHCVCEHESG